jgi:hypothetical protein
VNFRPLGEFLLHAAFLKNIEVAHSFGLLFSTVYICINFDKNMDWATVWVTFTNSPVTMVNV